MGLIRLNNQSLTSVTSAGIPIRSGSVLQVQQNTYSTWTTTTGTSWAFTGLSCAITPKLITSELLIHTTIAGGYNNKIDTEKELSTWERLPI